VARPPTFPAGQRNGKYFCQSSKHHSGSAVFAVVLPHLRLVYQVTPLDEAHTLNLVL
jgi:hypothetical protein